MPFASDETAAGGCCRAKGGSVIVDAALEPPLESLFCLKRLLQLSAVLFKAAGVGCWLFNVVGRGWTLP